MPRMLLSNESYFAVTAGTRIIGSDGAEQVAVFDGVSDLEITYASDDTTITAADGKFGGTITVTGADLSSDAFNFIF